MSFQHVIGHMELAPYLSKKAGFLGLKQTPLELSHSLRAEGYHKPYFIDEEIQRHRVSKPLPQGHTANKEFSSLGSRILTCCQM